MTQHLIHTSTSIQYAKLSLNLHLQAARTADKCGHPERAATFVGRAFIVYEDEITADSKEQIAMLPVMVSTACSLRKVDQEEHEKLATKLRSYGTQLLRKGDQCTASFVCSHLFQKSEDEETRKKVRVLPSFMFFSFVLFVCIFAHKQNLSPSHIHRCKTVCSVR